MSIAPTKTREEHFVDMELASWQSIPEDLEGRIVSSIEELRTLFPADEIFNQVKRMLSDKGDRGTNFVRYVRPYKRGQGMGEYVAYDCKTCKIVVGPPKVSAYDNIRPLSGSRGISMACRSCDTTLYVKAYMYA
jgi:hypothetical protein